MKTLRFLIPAMLTLTAILAACGGNSDASSPDDSATRQPSATARATQEAPAATPTTATNDPNPTDTPVAVATATPRAQQPVNSAPTPPPPPPAPTNTPVPPAVAPQALTIVAKGAKFNPAQLSANTGASVTVTLDNQDAGIQHDIIIYSPSGATAGQTAAFAGPAQQSATFTPTAAGNYFFKCSLHPITMTGSISIQP